MGNVKEDVRHLLETLPDDVPYQVVRHHFYVQQAVRRGIDAAERVEIPSLEDGSHRRGPRLHDVRP